MKYLAILLTLLFVGCTVSRSMDVGIKSKRLVTPYGAGDINLGYKSNTNTGFLNGR